MTEKSSLATNDQEDRVRKANFLGIEWLGYTFFLFLYYVNIYDGRLLQLFGTTIENYGSSFTKEEILSTLWLKESYYFLLGLPVLILALVLLLIFLKRSAITIYLVGVLGQVVLLGTLVSFWLFLTKEFAYYSQISISENGRALLFIMPFCLGISLFRIRNEIKKKYAN